MLSINPKSWRESSKNDTLDIWNSTWSAWCSELISIFNFANFFLLIEFGHSKIVFLILSEILIVVNFMSTMMIRKCFFKNFLLIGSFFIDVFTIKFLFDCFFEQDCVPLLNFLVLLSMSFYSVRIWFKNMNWLFAVFLQSEVEALSIIWKCNQSIELEEVLDSSIEWVIVFNTFNCWRLHLINNTLDVPFSWSVFFFEFLTVITIFNSVFGKQIFLRNWFSFLYRGFRPNSWRSIWLRNLTWRNVDISSISGSFVN